MRHATTGWLGVWMLAVLGGGGTLQAEPLPRGEDVVEFAAIGEGLWVHPLFQSNMVLQRDKPIAIWGWAAPGEQVTVEFDGKKQTATAAQDRTWKVAFPALPAGTEPRRMVIRGSEKTVTLDNILLGDVWVLGGQSNMEFEIAKLDNGDLEIASAHFKNIRLLTVPAKQGIEPRPSFPRLHEWNGWFGRHFRKGDWDVCTPETVKLFTGIGYVFGRRVHMATQVPIGLIDVSRGGTTLETWTPIGVLQSMDSPLVKELLATWEQKIADWDPQADLQHRIQRHRDRVKAGRTPADAPEPSDLQPGPRMDVNRPGACYASMLAPIAGLQVKGAVWHQGFNNAFGETTTNGVFYRQVFPQMIAAWRQAFGNPDMAFGVISLCTAGAPQDLTDFLGGLADKGCLVREAQYQTFVDLYQAGDKNIGFASSFDQRRSWYHPQIKIPVGERIARWALATQYGLGIKWLPPRVKEMVVEDGRLVLKFDGQVGPYNDGPIYGFAIAGEDGVFHAADAVHPKTGPRSEDRTAIALSSPMVPKPLHYRYAWHRNPMANVKTRDHTDIPVAISRSDSWTLNDLYQAYVGKPTQAPAAMNRAERDALGRALQDADMKRRLHEAKALIDSQQPKEE